MPIDSTHPLYEKNLPIWQKCRDFATSGDAVKAKGEKYLRNVFERGATPNVPNIEDVNNLNVYDAASGQYEDYKDRALVYEATVRTVVGLVGAAMRKPPDISEMLRGLEAFLDNMIGPGAGVPAAASQVLSELLITGRVGLFLDRPRNPGDTADTDQPLQLNIYQAEQIINWRADPQTNVANHIVLQEVDFEQNVDDPYVWDEVTRYRELTLDENGTYMQVLWTSIETDSGDQWVPETIPIARRNQPLQDIPFVLLTPLGETTRIYSPPILGLANVNCDHYRLDADHKHGLHFCGLPTPYGTGIDVQRELPRGLVLGSAVAHIFENDNAALKYLTLNADEFSALAEEKKTDLELMALLGARLLGSTPKVAETATAAQIHASGETNSLMTNVEAVEHGLRRICELARDWQFLTGECDIAMNRDFINLEMSPQMLTALVATLQAGGMSMPTFLYNLRQGELRHPDLSDEDELTLIQEGNTMAGMGADPELLATIDTLRDQIGELRASLNLSNEGSEDENNSV